MSEKLRPEVRQESYREGGATDEDNVGKNYKMGRGLDGESRARGVAGTLLYPSPLAQATQ